MLLQYWYTYFYGVCTCVACTVRFLLQGSPTHHAASVGIILAIVFSITGAATLVGVALWIRHCHGLKGALTSVGLVRGIAVQGRTPVTRIALPWGRD